MKHIKLYEEYNSEKTIKETVVKWVVRFELEEGSHDPIEVENFDNLETATDYFNTTFEYIDDSSLRAKEHSKTLEKVIYNVTYTYDSDYEDKEDIEDEDKEWEIEDIEIIESQTYKINENSDNLLEEVEEWFKTEYNSNSYKYHDINIDYIDEDGDNETKRVKVRFSDHTENINNIKRFGTPDFNISIVITNWDATSNKFWSNKFERNKTQYELKYDSATNIEEIKQDISNLIEEIEESLK